MKRISQTIIVAFALSFASAIPSFGIEGINVSVQSSNVVLSWPSVDGSGATYIVQYRSTLNATDSWQTLTSSWPAAVGTNVTFFIHSNIVQYPVGGSESEMMGDAGGASEPTATTTTEPSVPMVMPANGSGDAVPLAVYPLGFDLSGFVIFDPATGEWVSGNGYTVKPANSTPAGDMQPMDDPGDSTNQYTGFYRVVQDGVRILDSTMAVLTNGIISNNVTVAFEAGNAANDGTGTNVLGNLECAVLLIDGTKFAGDGVIDFLTNASPWKFNMDTAYLENGTHTLQVAVTWLNPDNSNGNNVNITRYSDPITITVSNLIYYPNWEPEVGEMGISAYFVQTVFTNVDWQIDIYDVSSNLAQTLTGHTDDGTIEAYWNMVDTNGVTRTNADTDPEFSSVVTVYDAPISKSTPNKRQRHRDWPDQGVWTVAYQDFFKFEYSANNLMQGSINDYANTTAKCGGYYLYYPQPGQTNDIGQTYPLRYQKSNHPDTNITYVQIAKDDVLLENFLSNTNSRNFFYDGHGNANDIADVPANELNALIKHRYRFVMIDACSSANGDLDKAFGINGPGRFAQIYYHNTGIRPGAFCGYNEDVVYNDDTPVTINGVRYDDTIPDDVPYFITNFLLYWDLESGRLNDSIDYGRNNTPDQGGYEGRENHWVIYGYDDMRIDEDNHASDTW
ncbi:MAG: hypothetical protein ACREC8_09155 [Limisphaerales bacterium]